MIVRENLQVSVIWRLTWKRIAWFALTGTAAAATNHVLHPTHDLLPFSAVGALGGALAIFLGFRNNSSYDRWWEARKLWGLHVNMSRVFARQVLTFLDGEHAAAMGRELIMRHLAFTNALRMHLRKQPGALKEIETYLPADELALYATTQNLPARLLHHQGERLVAARKSGLMDPFSFFQVERTLTEFANVQGGCERIKNTPLPRQYSFYTRVFMYVYTTLLPFAVVHQLGWMTPLLTVPVCFMFAALEGVGRVNEDPFENRIQDTPMSSLCRTIEINLLEVLGEKDLPAPIQPVDGFLW